MTRRRTRSLAGLLACALITLLAAAAPAVATMAPKEIAAQLRSSPLVVDPSLDDAVPKAQRDAVLIAIRKAPYPVWVVFVPLTAGDRYGGDGSRFLDVVQSRLGRDGVYVTIDQVLTTRDFGVDDSHPDLFYATEVGQFGTADYQEPKIEKIRRFVEALSLSDADLATRFAETEARMRATRDAVDGPSSTTGGSDGGSGWLLPVLLGLGAVLAGLMALRLVRYRRRSARPAAPDEPLIPARVFEHASTAQAGELRDQIEARLLEFAARIDRRPTPERPDAQERQQHALDAYAAARRVLAQRPEMVDLVGALVLVEDGTRALAAAEALEAGRPAPGPSRLCFFDPRHPGVSKLVDWERGLRVPACQACRNDLRAGRPPDALRDDGRVWFETDSLWARTGFGVFEPDLAERLLRGERTRPG
jgi:hypothetical protein